MGTGRVNWLFGHADSLLGSDLGSSRLLSCSTVPQNLTSGRHSERLTPKSLILEVIGLERMGPIFMAASCSQDVTRPIHQDPTRGSPRGYCDDRSDYARIMRPSARRPPEPRPGLHSARPQSTVCGRAHRSEIRRIRLNAISRTPNPIAHKGARSDAVTSIPPGL